MTVNERIASVSGYVLERAKTVSVGVREKNESMEGFEW